MQNISDLTLSLRFVWGRGALFRTSRSGVSLRCRRSVRAAEASGEHWGCPLPGYASPVPVLP